MWYSHLACKGTRHRFSAWSYLLHIPLDGNARQGIHNPYAQINQVAVLPFHRGHAIGRVLFQKLLQNLSTATPTVAGDLRIEVADRNVAAVKWYNNLGFVEISEWQAFPKDSRVVFKSTQRRTHSLTKS